MAKKIVLDDGSTPLPEPVSPVSQPTPPQSLPDLSGLTPQQAIAKLQALVGPGPAPSAARVERIPPAVKIHWRKLYPNVVLIDPQTGMPRPERQRRGGQFAARRLALRNTFNPNVPIRYAVVPVEQPEGQWQIPSYERVLNPSDFPEDREPGNVEVIFDFEDELLDFKAAFHLSKTNPLAGGASAYDMAQGRGNVGFEGIRYQSGETRNEVDQMQPSPPPGGYPTAA